MSPLPRSSTTTASARWQHRTADPLHQRTSRLPPAPSSPISSAATRLQPSPSHRGHHDVGPDLRHPATCTVPTSTDKDADHARVATEIARGQLQAARRQRFSAPARSSSPARPTKVVRSDFKIYEEEGPALRRVPSRGTRLRQLLAARQGPMASALDQASRRPRKASPSPPCSSPTSTPKTPASS